MDEFEKSQISEKDKETRLQMTALNFGKKHYKSEFDEFTATENKLFFQDVIEKFKTKNLSIEIKHVPSLKQISAIKECVEISINRHKEFLAKENNQIDNDKNEQHGNVAMSEEIKFIEDKEEHDILKKNIHEYVSHRMNNGIKNKFTNLKKEDLEILYAEVKKELDNAKSPINEKTKILNNIQRKSVEKCVERAVNRFENKQLKSADKDFDENKNALDYNPRKFKKKGYRKQDPHIYIKDSDIIYGEWKMQRGQALRQFEFFYDSRASAEQIADGKATRYVRIKIPTLENRQKAHGDDAYKFGIDENGIDRDDKNRKPYIQIPFDELQKVCTSAKDKLMTNGFKEEEVNNLKIWYINNQNKDDRQAQFTTYFKALRYDVPRGNPLYNKFDKPQSKKGVTFWDLQKIFPKNQEELKQVLRRQVTRVVQSSGKNKSHEKEKEKNVNKDHDKEIKQDTDKKIKYPMKDLTR